MTHEFCDKHSGFESDIAHLGHDNKKQWEHIKAMGDRINNIVIRLNVILGSIMVAVLMILLDIIVRHTGNK